MDLLEYQVKEWFGKIGIPVLPSQRIDHPTDLKRLKIRYPIVLKSQVQAGEREKAGGVRIVETTIDAIAAAQNIFNLPIWGQLPEVLLAESKYDAQEEFYLAVVLDTALCRPVLLGCTEANIEWETAGEKIQHVVVEQEFSPFYARRLALKMGLQGALMQSVSDIVEKLYQLFVQKDLDLVEIHPLGVNAVGQVMALNGKVRVNERAINRHPEIADMAAKMIVRRLGDKRRTSLFSTVDTLEMRGKIGILGNGKGSVLTTLDAIINAHGKPGKCVNLRHLFMGDTVPTNFCDRLISSLTNLADDQSSQVILVNFLGTIPQVEQLPEIITKFLQSDRSKITPQMQVSNGNESQHQFELPHLVLRLAGSEFNSVREYLATLKTSNQSLIVLENLDEAVKEAVRLAKLSVVKKANS
ncbi:succinate--CoA ligase subunit beta [Dolichospermum sp. ST_con]|nr:succinate--CoA ligase subunit beta [Dolichospermum sp. ST_con]MDD1421399.1 succinate--CoA ligase subunit beta [Dolichospermum sp. ST_sed1]MDD1427664.1 succinate--CoA ligase subunit beta [Dolichospermum sp. ST_sed9]MDD1433395.1 succinate--CoA ligase subunit beta [Dolichospermum sp. ST_sed6]MDD1442743.1 succinate--CoA ligase subunit beta [Dolichospermum sp. ST_sed3]MDD1448407.1 succinate--CoA ligase subunit beta [Dolichospermum sp. ST_sed8]MDD1457968.1 succinate--CoA ligase subunit beta [Dol